MSNLRSMVRNMVDGSRLEATKVALEAEKLRLEEERRQEEIRAAEELRRDIARFVVNIVGKIYELMADGTLDGIRYAQQLLGDRNSKSLEDQIHREIVSTEIAKGVNIDRKKPLSDDEAYNKLCDFLRAAFYGFDDAVRLIDAYNREDVEEILRITAVGSDKRREGSLAAAIAILQMEGDWKPSMWSMYGFDVLKRIREESMEILNMYRTAGVTLPKREDPSVIKIIIA